MVELRGFELMAIAVASLATSRPVADLAERRFGG
jgi:hypothetical protein